MNNTVVLLVDTHSHAHLKRERHPAYCVGDSSEEEDHHHHQQQQEQKDDHPNSSSSNLNVVSVTLAVEPDDWEDAIKYSSSSSSSAGGGAETGSDRTLMGLGIHPWYLGGRIEEENARGNLDNDDDDTNKNTRRLIIEPQQQQQQQGSSSSCWWKERLSNLLERHPSAIVGEIGLCKMAKCARLHPLGKGRGFEIQRLIFQQQWELAVKYRRPNSVHCVQQHGVFMDMIKEITTSTSERGGNNDDDDDPFRRVFVPPAIAMHSYTGTSHHIQNLLQWEASLFGEAQEEYGLDHKKKKMNNNDNNNNTKKNSTEKQQPTENENQQADNNTARPGPRPPPS